MKDSDINIINDINDNPNNSNIAVLGDEVPNSYYFEDIMDIPNMLFNCVELFQDQKLKDDLNKMTLDMQNKLYSEFSSPDYKKRHVVTQGSSKFHTVIPQEGYQYFLGKSSEIEDIINKLEEKYPDNNSIERRIINIIKTHSSLIVDNPHYLDALEIDPLYSQIIDSIFATFPIPMFKNGKKENGKDVYEFNKSKYENLMNAMKLLEIAEETQDFFKNQAIPYAAELKKGKVNKNMRFSFQAHYELHIDILKRYMNITNKLPNDWNLVVDCETFKTKGIFKTNFKDRFVDIFIGTGNEYLDAMKNGWPIEDAPMIFEIKKWYQSLERDANRDPNENGYDIKTAQTAKAIIKDLSSSYNALMNAKVNDNKTRKKLLTDFNKKFSVHESKLHSLTLMNGEYVEAAIKKDYEPYMFSDMFKSTVDNNKKNVINAARNVFDNQSDIRNKIDVLFTFQSMISNKNDFNNNRYYGESEKLVQIGHYDFTTDYSTTEELAVVDDFVKKIGDQYTNDFDGLEQLINDFGNKYIELINKVAKERQDNEKLLPDNEESREQKLDYITINSSDNILQIRTFSVLYQKLVADIDRFSIDDFNNKLAQSGRKLEELTVKQVGELCGYSSTDVEKISENFHIGKEHFNNNFINALKEEKKGLNDEQMDEYIQQTIHQAISNGLLAKIINDYRNTLSDDEKQLFDKANGIIDAGYASKLQRAKKDVVVNKETNKKEKVESDFGKWAREEGDNIIYEYKKYNALNNYEQQLNYFVDNQRTIDNRLDFKENAVRISDFYKTLDDNTHWYKGGSSRNFDKMMTDLSRLKDLATKLSDNNRGPNEKQLNEYLTLAKKVDDRATYYLDNKAPSDSQYAAKRVALVKNVRKHIRENVKAFEAYISNTVKINDNPVNEDAIGINGVIASYNTNETKRNALFTNNEDFKKLYQGDKYTDQALEAIKSGTSYSIDRNAAYSIAIAYLLVQVDDNKKPKYTYDDIMSLDKLGDEKKEAFDIVVNKIKETNSDKTSAEANKWLADIIYKGEKASVKIMDEELKKLDFSDDKVFDSDDFIKARTFAYIQYDLWQEMAHCQDELMELVKVDHPNMKEYDTYKDYFTSQIAPMSTLDSSYMQVYNDLTNIVNLSGDSAAAVIKCASIDMAKKRLKEWNDSGKKEDFSVWCKKNNRLMSIDNTLTLGLDITNFVDAQEKIDMKKHLTMSALDGSLFVNLKYLDDKGDAPLSAEPDPNDPYEEYTSLRSPLYSGLPTCKQLVEDDRIRSISETDIKRTTDKMLKSIDAYMKKTPVDNGVVAYAKNAKKSVKIIEDILINKKTISKDNIEQVKKSIRDITAYNFAKEFKKAGFSEKKLKTAVKTAMGKATALNEAMEYIGVGTIYNFAYGNEAKKIIKKSPDAVFAGKAEAAVYALTNEDYRGRQNDYIKDAAYAFTGQQIRVNGNLIDEKTKVKVPAKKYVDKLIGSKKFKDSLKSEDPNKMKCPKLVAKMAKDDRSFKQKQKELQHKANMEKVNSELRNSIGQRNSRVSQTSIKK